MPNIRPQGQAHYNVFVKLVFEVTSKWPTYCSYMVTSFCTISNAHPVEPLLSLILTYTYAYIAKGSFPNPNPIQSKFQIMTHFHSMRTHKFKILPFVVLNMTRASGRQSSICAATVAGKLFKLPYCEDI